VLPAPVLEQARQELAGWRDSGMSVLEMSHRGKEFIAIAEAAEAGLRALMAIPDDYRVLFLQGGATGQFAAVPMNLAVRGIADYVVTGSWGTRAVAEGGKYLDTANIAAAAKPPTHVPPASQWQRTEGADYLHITLNETIHGVRFDGVPDSGATPLVADASSMILSEPIDITRFGVLYAGAQKNIGPSGLVVVIVREDLLGLARPVTPQVWNWQDNAKSDSMINTPPTFAWYIAGLVFEWVASQGGVAAMAAVNRRKAARLYDAIDRSAFYANPVEPAFRSLMNVPFTLAAPELDAVFLSEARAAGLVELKGHRSVGGMRASIYNAMPEAGVDALVDFMAEFEAQHG
jgi:phosphoserine aminotransferase